MDREGYFTVRDIVDFAYCPRSIYFQYCIKGGKERTPKMGKGLELHESFSDKSKRTKIVRDLPKLRKEFGVRLSSKKYGFNTVVDSILFDGREAYPVEFKFSPKPKILYNTHRYQLVAQAIAIEEVLKKRVPFAYIKYVDGSITKLSITPRLKERVTKILEEMEEIVKFERMPKPAKSKKRCKNCFYKKLCRSL
jgi:CRISPR-associated exonuclease Cas4